MDKRNDQKHLELSNFSFNSIFNKQRKKTFFYKRYWARKVFVFFLKNKLACKGKLFQTKFPTVVHENKTTISTKTSFEDDYLPWRKQENIKREKKHTVKWNGQKKTKKCEFWKKLHHARRMKKNVQWACQNLAKTQSTSHLTWRLNARLDTKNVTCKFDQKRLRCVENT